MFDYTQSFSNLLSHEECDSIVNLALEKKLTLGKNLSKNDNSFYDFSHRKCEVVWFYDNLPIEDIDTKLKNQSLSFVNDVIKADHNNQFIFQVARYNIGDFHNWHIDDNQDRLVGFRKFVTIVALSNPSDYDGGELEIENIPKSKMEKGQSISFLTIRRHRVLPITKGTRYSLVVWLFGPPWR